MHPSITFRVLARCLGRALAPLMLLACTTAQAQLPRVLVPIPPDSPGLAFPFQSPVQVAGKHEYNLPNWDGAGQSHCEIDVVAVNASPRAISALAPVVAAWDGTVSDVQQRPGDGNTTTWGVVLDLNAYWSILYTFEPKSTNAAVNALQEANLPGGSTGLPAIGSSVTRGQVIGRLVLSPTGTSKAEIGFALLYRTPGISMDYVAANVAHIPRIPARGWPAFDVEGCPWKPIDLGLVAAFFSPYAYSSPWARQRFDALPVI